jgi:hypothetical protein
MGVRQEHIDTFLSVKDIHVPEILSLTAINFKSCVSNVVLIFVRKYKHFRSTITDFKNVLWCILVLTFQGMHYFHASISAQAEINLVIIVHPHVGISEVGRIQLQIKAV